MKFRLNVFRPKNKKEEDKVMEELNKWGAQMYAEAYAHYSALAKSEGDKVFTIFDDWWHGKSVCTDEYKSNYTEEEHRTASSIILTAVSNGFG
ncbi:hypothetical protein QCM8_25 [Bacillus phage QCM8]|nr:hypothetical protein QCM8_25 [Bacillus phage QCM8]